MNLKLKKVLAREFLLLVTCILVFGLTFLATTAYNGIQTNKIDDFKNQQQVLKDELNQLQRTYSTKIDNQERFYKESVKYKWHTKNWNSDELWNRLQNLRKSDSVDYKWNNIFSNKLKNELEERFNFTNGKDFENFIDNNTLSEKDTLDIEKVKQIQTELDDVQKRIKYRKTKIINNEKRMEYSYLYLIICGVILFPIRYIIYGVKWSLKTLKQNE